MTAPHFFTDDVSGELIRIEGADARHALRSLRLRAGEVITVADGRGTVVDARVRDAGGGEVLTAEVLQRREVREVPPAIWVYPALPKSDKLELIVQKLTEIGTTAIQPWPAARSVARWDERKAARAMQRLAAIAREAAMRSRRVFLPILRPPVPLSELPVPTFALHEGAASGLLGALPDEPPDSLGLVTGPEGGLSEDEVAWLERAGARIVGLGSQILRTETAAIAAAVLALGRYGKLG